MTADQRSTSKKIMYGVDSLTLLDGDITMGIFGTIYVDHVHNIWPKCS